MAKAERGGRRVVRAQWRADCPDREPNGIYDSGQGYRVMRWIEPNVIVEMLEHRWIMDPGPGKQVHHIDHDRSNNDPSNLEVLTTGEHGRRHRAVADDELLDLHRQGLRQVHIASRLGVDSSQVSRRLAALGVAADRSAPNRVDVDPTPVLRLHDQGHRVGAICRHLGLTDMVVRRVLREGGRKPHGPGRPPAHIANLPPAL